MQRIDSQPRANWEQIVESQGFHFHTPEDEPYWDESAYYLFTAAEIDLLEKASYDLDKMCLDAVQHVIDEKLFDLFLIPPRFVDYVVNAWNIEEDTLYGRFDLAYDGVNPPKLLEYNADTPTALLEAAVIQWYWFKDTNPSFDQFNSIHDRLIEAWKSFAPDFNRDIYFSAMAGHLEDFMTVQYLRDTANQAGYKTQYIDVEKIGFNPARRLFLDESESHIQRCFKLYPWEWMIREQFGPMLPLNTTRWLEAPWKMILSNKAILPILHQLFPDSPYLLPAAFEPLQGPHVRKPLLSREGANIIIYAPGHEPTETEGPYTGPYVYQQYHPLADFKGNHPVIGSWMINGYAAGIGIREDVSPVTGNFSRFVPHLFSNS